jgi:hypothetical protein
MKHFRDFIGLSDIHFSLQNLAPALEVLEQALMEAKVRDLPLYIGGDLNDTKAILRGEVVQALINLFNKYRDVRVIVLVGNHDLLNHNGSRHSLEFLKLLPNVTVVDQPQVVGDWHLIPYVHDKQTFLKELDSAKQFGSKRLLIHQGVLGALMSEYAVDESSVGIESFAEFDTVLSGHYHLHQRVGSNFIYFGSPFTTRFDESSHPKYIHHVSLVPKFSIESIKTCARRHYQFEFDGEIHWPDRVESNSLVKLVVKGSREFCSSVTKKDAQHHLGCENVIILPVITKIQNHRLNVNSGMGPTQVIDSFLERAATSLDKDKLKQYLSKVFQ